MACYHPLTAYGIMNEQSGKMKIVFLKNEPTGEHLKSIGAEKLKLPCGNCVGCRLEYSRQWAIRCFFEAKQWKHNYFVTLTYNDENVPMRPHCKVDPATGEVMDMTDVMTLDPPAFSAFVKRLRTNMFRRNGHKGIRFFGCGEYGPLNMRPHYHLILFNCPLDDLKVDKVENGYTYYRSEFIEKTWGKGFVTVTDFSFETAAYVARYVLKKHKGKDRYYYEDKGIEPEFTRCSRRPGIAYQYFDENEDRIYSFDEVFFVNGKGKPLKVKPPKYFDRLFDIDHPSAMVYIKERRKDTALNSMDYALHQTDLDEDAYLCVKENNKVLSVQKLKRGL